MLLYSDAILPGFFDTIRCLYLMLILGCFDAQLFLYSGVFMLGYLILRCINFNTQVFCFMLKGFIVKPRNPHVVTGMTGHICLIYYIGCSHYRGHDTLGGNKFIKVSKCLQLLL